MPDSGHCSRSDESILCEVFRQPDIADDPRQAGDEPRRLDPPDCVDCAMCIGGHCYPSHHLQSPRASPDAPCDETYFYAMRDRSFICCAKSSGPKIWRISVSPSHPGQCFLSSSMKRTAPSIASSFDFSSNSAQPPTTSLASVKGPSVTLICPPESRTQV